MFDPTAWLVGVVAVLTGTVFTLALVTLAVWAEGNARQRRRRDQRDRWEPMVLEYLCSPDTTERRSATLRIGQLVGARERDGFTALVLDYLGELRGDDAEHLRALLRSLGATERAARLLRSRNPWRRALAARALGLLRAHDCTAALIDAAHDRHPVASYAAAAALISIGGRGALSAVATTLGRRGDWNAAQTHELLDQGGIELGEDLSRLLMATPPADPRARSLVEMLGQIRFVPVAESLKHWLGHELPVELRVSIVRALGRMGDHESAGVLRTALAHAVWVVRSQAALALGRVGDPEAVPLLEAALGDESFWVRCNAAIALAELGADGRDALARVARAGGPAALVAREALGGSLQDELLVARRPGPAAQDSVGANASDIDARSLDDDATAAAA